MKRSKAGGASARSQAAVRRKVKPARTPRAVLRPVAESAPRRATIRDVSRLARVSRMTVSRYFASPELVLPATRERVAHAVRHLSYVPDRAAGSLSSRRSGFIALILPSLTNSNFASVAHGLTEILQTANLQLLIGYTEYSVGVEESQIRQMLARRPEAIIVMGKHHSRDGHALLAGAGVPVVELGDLHSRPIDMAVGFSNREVGRLAARHLMASGFKNIAAIGPCRVADRIDSRGEERLEAFEETLKVGGLRTDLVLRHCEPPVSYTQGASAMAALLAQEPKTEAVFAISDLAAVGAMMECRRRGIDVPGQIALVGFGDFDIAAQMAPSLTTIAVDFDGLGRRAGEIVLAVLGNKVEAVPHVTDVGVRFVQRDSTPRSD